MKRILIIGSEGMLGSALLSSFKGPDIEVIGTDIRAEKNPLDITKPDDTTDFIKQVRPDVVIHVAAYTDVDGCELNLNDAYLINSEGTKNIANACKQIGAFLIYISTDFVFDGNKAMPYIEDDVPSPISIYGRSKLQGEQRVRQLLERYLIIRTSWLFGESGKNFVDTIIKKAESGEPLRVVDDQRGSPTYAKDLADAIVAILLTAHDVKLTTLHITNSGSCTWYDFAKEIIRGKGMKGVNVEPVSSDQIKRPAKRPKMCILDNTRFIKASGGSLPSWQDALARYLSSEER